MLTAVATPRSTRTTASFIALLLATTLTGCAAASDSTPESPADESQSDSAQTDAGESDDSGNAAGPSGGGGTVSLGTTIYTVNETYNCEIFPSDTAGAPEELLDLIVLGTSSSGADMQLNVYLQRVSGVSVNTVDYSGDEGLFSNDGDIAVREEGDTIIGAGAVVDDANTETFLLQFTLVVPDETIDCR